VDNELTKYINQGLPIGKAIDGVKVFVLGEDLQSFHKALPGKYT
jgi:hypothetical protein